MKQSRQQIGNALLSGALVLGSGTSLAARSGPGADFDASGNHGDRLTAAGIDDEWLHRFIDAAHDVQAIRRDYAARLGKAGKRERSALRAQAREEMMAAIERQGLEVSQYREIGYLLERDDELSNRLDGASRANGRDGPAA